MKLYLHNQLAGFGYNLMTLVIFLEIKEAFGCFSKNQYEENEIK